MNTANEFVSEEKTKMGVKSVRATDEDSRQIAVKVVIVIALVALLAGTPFLVTIYAGKNHPSLKSTPGIVITDAENEAQALKSSNKTPVTMNKTFIVNNKQFERVIVITTADDKDEKNLAN